jgi:hypothetical protein
MTAKNTKPRTDKETVYKISQAERAVIGKCLLRNESTAPVRFKVAKTENAVELELDHPDAVIGHALTMNAFGSADGEFCAGMMKQLVKANESGEGINEGGLNFMVSIINGIEPRDQVEAMLAAQMAAVHVASMNFARRLETATTAHELDCSDRAFNKLTRTFTSQMEALKRYRSRGEQKITNVSIGEGGQAIVGDITQVRRDNVQEKPAASASAAVTGTNVIPMTGADASKERAVAAGGADKSKARRA